MAKTTAAEATNAEEIIFCGCDDGHDSIKLEIRSVTTKDGRIKDLDRSHLSMPSKVVRGSRVLALTGDDTGDGLYSVPVEKGGTEAFTVTDALTGNDLIDTRSINYPVSAVNRVLVNDALIRANLSGKKVRIVTGLPVNDYYNKSGPNTELIGQKKANLLEGVVIPLRKNLAPANIVDHMIACEGIAAVYDMAIRDDGTDDPHFFKLLEQAPVGVIDIGGKTIDLAVVYLDRGSSQVDRQRTHSIDFGMLRLMQDIKDEIKTAHSISDIAPRAMFKVLTDRKLMVQGEFVDVSAEVQSAISKALPDLFERIRSIWGKAEDLAKVIVVGGGAYMMASEIKEGLYRHAETRQEPEFANARGMLKLGMRHYLAQNRQPVAAA